MRGTWRRGRSGAWWWTGGDQYALGCAAFERDQDVAVIWARLPAPPLAAVSRRPDLLPGVDEVLGMAPGGWCGSCGEFAEALRQALGLPGCDSGRAAVCGLPAARAGRR